MAVEKSNIVWVELVIAKEDSYRTVVLKCDEALTRNMPAMEKWLSEQEGDLRLSGHVIGWRIIEEGEIPP